MKERTKTIGELTSENENLKERIRELENLEAERRRVEATNPDSELRYKTIFETSGTTMMIVDEDMTVALANSRFEKLTGWKREEFEGKRKWTEFVEPNDLAMMVAQHHLRRMEPRTAKRSYEFRLVHKNGSIKNIFVTVDLIPGSKQSVASLLDITDLKRADEKLRESERKYHELYDFLPIPIYEVDLEGGIKSANGATLEAFGGSEEELKKGVKIWKILPPGEIEKAKRNIQKILAGERTLRTEYTLKRLDGSLFPAILVSSPIYENGKPVGLRGAVVDITERRRQEEEIRRVSSFLDSIIENIPDMIFVKDARDLRFVRFNRAGEDLLGHSRNDLLGKNDHDFFPKEQADFFTLKDRNVLGEGKIVDIPEEPINTRFKGERILHTKKVPIFDSVGKPEYLLGISEDITDRKKSEEERQDNQTKLQAIFNQVGAGILIIDKETQTIIEANQTASEMTGLPKEKILGRSCHRLVCPAEVGKCPVKNLGQTVERSESVLLHADGTQLDILKTVFPIILKGRECFLESFIDISDRLRAEKLLRKSEERLQRAEKMEALGTLAGGVAHDLNNVLGIVVGYAELVLYGMEESNPLRSSLQYIMDGAQRASAIVQDLLTLARRGVSGKKVLNLNRLVQECRQSPEFLKLIADHPSTRISWELDPNLLNISASPVHMVKSTFNLILNACEAIRKEGAVTIRTFNQYVDKPLQGFDETREGDYVVLSITDTGEGIPPNDLKRIFEPFYTKKVMGRSGTGLGLAVVWGTVKDHQGYINVQSEEGKGSVFSLFFPVTREELPQECSPIPVSDYMGDGQSILVVDDVKGQRELAAEMLRRLKYRVVCASSGEEAVEYLKTHSVDLIVLDMIMDPGMDGLDTFQRIIGIRPDQKAIIVSGFSETNRVNATQALGAGAYVRKPYVLEKLGLAVKKELERK